MMPRRPISSAFFLSIRVPFQSMLPSVTSPSSTCSNPEMAFRVVLLPAPLAPNKATIGPFLDAKRYAVEDADHIQIGDFDIVQL